MKLIYWFEKVLRFLLPSPLSIAIFLTFIAMLLAYFTWSDTLGWAGGIEQTFQSWFNGLWQGPLLIFAFQMILILVLGHALALSKPIDQLLTRWAQVLKGNSRAIVGMTIIAIVLGYLNWGFALVFCALLSHKIAQVHALAKEAINYPLLGASAYLCMLVFHGGLSGSAPLKIVKEGHLADMAPEAIQAQIPKAIPLQESIFSGANLAGALLLLIALSLFAYLLSRTFSHFNRIPELKTPDIPQEDNEANIKGFEKVDYQRWFVFILGLMMIAFVAVHIGLDFSKGKMDALNLNRINFLLLGFGLILHPHITAYQNSVGTAMKSATGIILQFPLYFGIMALLRDSGWILKVSSFLVENSPAEMFPYVSYISAALVNIFVPSGGGQWAIQGPLIIETCTQYQIPLNKSIMAMCYGDQLTNMLQPFWAIPLLSITGLKAKHIFLFTTLYFILAFVLFLIIISWYG